MADSITTFNHIHEGDSLYRISQYEAAVLKYHAVLAHLKEQDNLYDYLRLYEKISSTYLLMGEQDKGLEYALKILRSDHKNIRKIALIHAEAHELAGYTLSQRGEFDSSLVHYHKCLKIRKQLAAPNDMETGHCLYAIGNVHYNRGMYVAAIEAYKSASTVYSSNNKKGKNNLAYAYNNMALAFDASGSFNLALEYYNNALNLWTDLYGSENQQITFAYNNIATVYFHLDSLNKALDYYILALEIKNKLKNNDASRVNTLINIGICYLRLKDFDLAMKYTLQARDLADSAFEKNRPIIGIISVLLGNIHVEQNRFNRAMKEYNKARGIFLTAYGNCHPDLAELYNNMADGFERRGNYPEAIEWLDMAISANIPDFRGWGDDTLLLVKSTLNKGYLMQSLVKKSDLLIRMGSENQSIVGLEKALQTLQIADALIEDMRRFHIRQNDKVTLGQSISRVYENAIRTCLELYTLTGDTTYHERSFYYAERSRSSVLTEALNSLTAKNFGHIPDDLLTLERSLKADLSYFTTKIQRAKSTEDPVSYPRLSDWENKLFRTKQLIDSLNIRFEKDFPKYYHLKYENRILELRDVQKELEPNTCLLEYIVGESSTYVFKITHDYFDVIQLVDGELSSESVQILRQSLKDFEHPEKAYQHFVESSYSIYNTYVKEAILGLGSEIDKLIIIPGGILSYVPFEILLTENSSDQTAGNYKALPYLIKKFNISYGYSTSLLFNEYEKKGDAYYGDLLAFAPSYEGVPDDGSNANVTTHPVPRELTALTYNVSEVESINQLIDGDSHLRENATERAFKESAGNYKILHLAMHALINDNDPMNSRLVFTQEPDSIEDNYLYAHELYNMEIPADLTVLSACESGFGKLVKGEGMMSLARAFSYAGCPSVVMSYWSVNDRSTSILMETFYKYLADGLGKDEALRMAKLEYIDKSRPFEANPFFWGGFLVIGDISPLDEQSNFSGFIFLFLVIPLLGALLYTLRLKTG